MVLVDANVVLYAVDSASSHHGESRGWLDRALAGAETVGFSWVVLLVHLATLAVEHGAEIVSYDRNFGRFPGVSHRLPA